MMRHRLTSPESDMRLTTVARTLPTVSVALAGLLLATVPLRAQQGSAVVIDHLIIGVDDLDRGMREFAERTGVRPIKGGVHPGRGTQNALVSLGDGRYLEIMAPSHEPGTEPDPRTSMRTLTPVGWALRTTDIAATVALVKSAGFGMSDIAPGARARPDGRQLRWQTASVSSAGMEAAPFFIAWAPGSAHPSTDAPGGCTLVSVAMEEPNPAPLTKFLRTTGVAVPVAQGAVPLMSITLSCGGKRVVF